MKRITLVPAFIVLALLVHLQALGQVSQLPTDDPVTAFYADRPDRVPEWVKRLPWDVVVDIRTFDGERDDQRLAAAQEAVVARGGGVIYFPPGVYRFSDHILLRPGVILRGAAPAGVTRALDEDFMPATQFEFPRYRPRFSGEGTPINTAFKGIRLADPAGHIAGVVHININRGHIDFAEGLEYQTGTRRLVFGCRLTNTATADPSIPDSRYGHQPHQRWTARHQPAINAHAGRDVFIANNRIPPSGEDNFVIPNYSLVNPQGNSQQFRLGMPHEIITITDGVVFDYDNRPGIYVNGFAARGATPDTHPHFFRPGLIIRDNFIYCTGRTAIHFTGDGTLAAGNVIRFPAGVWRPTATGGTITDGSSTNDNRALTMRGWRWTAKDNDFIVHANITFRGNIAINDAEGIMHEGFGNSSLKDSRIIGNRGNRYICIWRTDVDGLEIRDNIIGDDSDPAIHIFAPQESVRNLVISNNRVTEGIMRVNIARPENIAVHGNQFIGRGMIQTSGKPPVALPGTSPGRLLISDPSWAKDNPNFLVEPIR